ncbi:asparaginyl-tRNA synthetase isoform X1 [Procambarus clarkii]|uniref:asparaginyl-tRNA synthetase isoform X1 n=1 Tax=Procambarus clarkii TaxID=6728 RepID=UPI003743CF32
MFASVPWRLGLRCYSSGCRTSSILALLHDKPINQTVKVNGWVKGIRRQKERIFVDVDDGSCSQKLQVVLPSGKRSVNLGFHASVSATGILHSSSHKGQDVEMVTDEIQVIGGAVQEEYPFKSRQLHPPEYVRKFPHLRARTNSFSSLLRVRSQAKMAIQEYFRKEGFINIDTPVLTTNDCEGGGETFSVRLFNSNTTEERTANDSSYFGQEAHLSVSGQLHLEAIACGLSKVYNFNPAFRAENSHTRRHLAEFWMAEAEEAFLCGTEGLSLLMDRIEGLIKTSIQTVIDVQEEDVLYHWKSNESTEELVKGALCQPFVRLPYAEAMKLLQDKSHFFQTQPLPRGDLGKEHELFLTKHLGNIPVFVTHWPREIKAFYMCADENDPQLVMAVDLLLPDIGEVAGGGLREHCPSRLHQRLQQLHLLDKLDWYLDLRRLGGSTPTGGFGIGFERFLQFILGIGNIKDTIPFPRWAKHCSC